MITFKEHRNLSKKPSKEITEEDLKNLQELSPVVSQVVFELQEFIWKVLKLLGLIIKFLVVNGIKTMWGSGKFLYRRYNKQGRADRRFNKQMAKTSKQIKKLRMAKGKYENAILRLESMKGSLESMSKEDQQKHKKELYSYYDKIDELTKQANEAMKKLKAVK